MTGSFTHSDKDSDLISALLFRLNLDERSKSYNINFTGLFEKFLREFKLYYTEFAIYVIAFFITLNIYVFIKKFKSRKTKRTKGIIKLYEKTSLPILIFLSYLSFLFLFSNYYWIHDYLIIFLIPGYFLIVGLLFDNIFNILYNLFLKIGFKNKLATIVTLLIFIVFFIFYIKRNYSLYVEVYNQPREIIPIADFLSKNRDNIIVTYKEYPGYCQLQFYYASRVVGYAQNKEDLLRLLRDNGSRNFRYIITKGSYPIEDDMISYLNSNFEKFEIKENENYNYTIFIVRN